MEKDIQKFNQANTEVIALAVQTQKNAKASVESALVSYPILADPQHKAADAYGVFNLLHDNVATPAVFVINKRGEIVWSYIGKDINDRPDNGTILSNLPRS